MACLHASMCSKRFLSNFWYFDEGWYAHVHLNNSTISRNIRESISSSEDPGTQSHEAITSSLGQKKYVWKEFEPFGHFGCFFAGVVIFVDTTEAWLIGDNFEVIGWSLLSNTLIDLFVCQWEGYTAFISENMHFHHFEVKSWPIWHGSPDSWMYPYQHTPTRNPYISPI